MIDGRADLVVCDGAPDVTGLHDIDEYIQVGLPFFRHSAELQDIIFQGTTATCRPEHQHSCASLRRNICCEDFQRERCQLALQVKLAVVTVIVTLPSSQGSLFLEEPYL